MRKTKKKQRVTISRGLFLAVSCASLLGVFSYVDMVRWYRQPLAAFDRDFVLEAGSGLRSTAQRLADMGVIDSPERFWIMVRALNKFPRFQAGKYRFSGQLAPVDVINHFVEGRVYRPVVAEVTIPEGFTFVQIAKRLAKAGIGSEDEFIRLATDEKFLTKLSLLTEEARHIEGFLYPATYRFYEVLPTARGALRQMVSEFFRRLPESYRADVGARGLSLYKAVTFASLIEKETAVDHERSRVSEVIWRRLKDREPLAIDAALIYGIVDYAGNIRTVHLRDRSNRYNTRIHKGLPPTPICSPAVASLSAVLTPTDLGNKFYVLIPGGGGRHHFSKTLAEHQRHVRKLVRASR